jgi:polar amino acid transport system substrate-binding protein
MGKQLLGLMLSVPLLGGAQPAVVTLAVDEAHRPYFYAQADEPEGLYAEILRAAMTRLPQWQLRFRPMPWKRALTNAERGEVDGFAAPYRHVSREWLIRYVGPLFLEEVALFCDPRLGLGATAAWPDGYLDLRMGAQRGYVLSERLGEAVSAGKVQRVDFSRARDALAALSNRQVDCVVDDRLSVESEFDDARRNLVWAARMPASLPAPVVLEAKESFVGFSRRSLERRPELAEFAKALDEQLALMRSSGEIARLARKHEAQRWP